MITKSINRIVHWSKENALPAMGRATEVTLTHIDAGCNVVNRKFVEGLKKYPGIALTLSPSTIIKVAAAHHVDEMMKKYTTTPVRAAAINDQDHAA